jgi:Ca-activated chloride channel family protein
MARMMNPRFLSTVLLLGGVALALSRPVPASSADSAIDAAVSEAWASDEAETREIENTRRRNARSRSAQTSGVPGSRTSPGSRAHTSGTPVVQRSSDATAGTLFYPSEDGTGFIAAPILESDVELRITGPIVRAIVRQRFRNPTPDWVEGLYVFPLPEMAAVDTLEMKVGDRIIEGQIQERAEARKTYEKARSEGRKASLVEQHRPNIFTTSVANIGPDEEVEITIEYQESLRFDEGGFRLRFPMVVAPRYTPGHSASETALATNTPGIALGSVPTIQSSLLSAADPPPPAPLMIHPDDGPIHRVNLRVSLDAGFAIERFSSPSHAMRFEKIDPTRRKISVHAWADRDFVLRWSPARGEEPTAAIFAEERDGETAVLLMVLPPSDEFEMRSIAREVVIVIDTSGSMGGASIVQARKAVQMALDQLGPDDWFNVIDFDSSTRRLFPQSVRAHRAELEQARSFVDSLDANGGTNMLPALEAALETGVANVDVRQVIFVTDGSIGNESELFRVVESQLGNSRLFPVGIGSAPNGYFLRRVAKFGRGTFSFIASPKEVAEQMERLFSKLERPALSDIVIHWDDSVEMWPRRIPDLYAGEPLMVTAKLDRFAGDVRISGAVGGKDWDTWLRLEPDAEEAGIGKLWARSKIAALMDEIHLGAKADLVREAVTDVALEYHLVSKFTSLVAVDLTLSRPAGEGLQSAALPLNVPRGWNPDVLPGVLPRTATPAPIFLLIGLAGLLGSLPLMREKARS